MQQLHVQFISEMDLTKLQYFLNAYKYNGIYFLTEWISLVNQHIDSFTEIYPALLTQVDRFSDKGVNLLTPEGKIILYLLVNGGSRVKEVMLASGVSYRGFYLTLDRLKEAGLVTVSAEANDRRVRIIQLAI